VAASLRRATAASAGGLSSFVQQQSHKLPSQLTQTRPLSWLATKKALVPLHSTGTGDKREDAVAVPFFPHPLACAN